MTPLTRRVVLGGLGVFFAVGAIGHLVPGFRPWMLALTPWFLWLAGVVVFVAVVKASKKRASLFCWVATYWVVTFTLEVVGVSTGWVFGPYYYQEVLGTRLWGVPPVIGWNWVLIILGIQTSVCLLLPRFPEVARIAVVALACVGFDALLEPVAMGLGYWAWDRGAVPVQNYVAWGLIGALGAWWANRFKSLPVEPVSGWYVGFQVVFFIVVGIGGVPR